MTLGNLEIHEQYIYTTSAGKKFLLIHGDQFDGVVRSSKTLALIGSALYELLLKLNHYLNFIRRKLGFSYWSLASMLKHKVKQAVNYISNFERVLAYEAHKQNVDGMITGHIHRAAISNINDVIYCNCGDWVESCTALVESDDGSIELIHWSDKMESLKKLDIAA